MPTGYGSLKPRRAGPSYCGQLTTGTSFQSCACINMRHTRLAYEFQPGGLRTGSPSSPPPHSIRLTVRRLLRSPRLWVRVPADRSLSGSGCRRLLLCDLNKLRENVFVMLLEVTSDPFISDQPADVSLGEHEIEMIRTI